MTATRTLVLALFVLHSAHADAQGADIDSLGSLSPRMRYAQVCPGPRDADTGALIGRVRDADDGSPLIGAVVSIEWAEFTMSGSGRSASHRARVDAQTNGAGFYLLCGVPTKMRLDVRSELRGFRAGPIPLVLDDRLISDVSFAISLHDEAARTLLPRDSFAISAAVPGTATLRGRVLGDDGQPARDVVIEVVDTKRSARTDASGIFQISKIPAGTRTVDVRAIGSVPTTVSIDFPTNALRDTTFSIHARAQDMTKIDVTERQILSSWMERSGFDERRQHGLGAFVTEQEIARHSFSSLISVLQGVRGVHVDYGGNGKTAGIASGTVTMLGITDVAQVRCKPNFYLDGAHFFGDFLELSRTVTPESIKGVEVYSNPGTIPAQFDMTSSTGCGSIVIWTR